MKALIVVVELMSLAALQSGTRNAWLAILIMIGAPFFWPPRQPHIVVARHARRFSAAGFFWTLAAWRSMREGSLRPLVHHAEWRAAWRLARGW